MFAQPGQPGQFGGQPGQPGQFGGQPGQPGQFGGPLGQLGQPGLLPPAPGTFGAGVTAAPGSGPGVPGLPGQQAPPGPPPSWKQQKADEIEAELREIEYKQERRRRHVESGTGTGLRDYVFNAPPLVEDLVTLLEPECDGMRMLLDVLENASMILKDESKWTRFSEIIYERVHRSDQEAHTVWLTTFENTWKQTMMMPKTGKGCSFLHLGTEPPTKHLMLLLNKLGWYGVSIAPTKPEGGFQDTITGIELDASSEEHEREFHAIMDVRPPYKGGCVPKPPYFPLAFCNFVYKVEELREEIFGPGTDDRTIPEEQGPKDPLGYGLIGVTRTDGVSSRLKGINTMLNTALSRLADKGTLIITWPGLPFHPALLFLTSYLRSLFTRVHVNMLEGTKTFELYIVCAAFNRDSSEKSAMGEGGFALKSFVNSAYRRPGLDDVLLWTLTDNALIAEATFGMNGTAASKGYDDLWKTFATKLRSFAFELGMVLDMPKKGEEKKRAPKAKAKGKAKAKAKLTKADDKDSGDDDGQGGGSDAGSSDEGRRAAGGKSPKAKAKRGAASPKASGRKAKRRGGKSKGDKDGEGDEDPANPDEAPGGLEAKKGGKAKKSSSKEGGASSSAGAAAGGAAAEGEGDDKLPPVPGASQPEAGDATAEGEEAGEQEVDQDGEDGDGEDYDPDGEAVGPQAAFELAEAQDKQFVHRKPQKKRLEMSRSLPSLSSTFGAAPGGSLRGPDIRDFSQKFPMLSYGLLVADNMSFVDSIDETNRTKRKLPPRYINAMNRSFYPPTPGFQVRRRGER